MHMNHGKNRSVHFVELHEKFYVHHESDGKRSIRLKEKWVVSAKGADFKAIGEHFGIDPVIARIMRNRGLTDLDEMEYYLHGDEKDLIGTADHERFIVKKEAFEAKALSKLENV